MPYICVSEESFARIADYSATYAMTNEKAVNKAVDHWWNEVAAWSIEEARKSTKKRRTRRPKTTPLSTPFVVPNIVTKSPEKIAVNQ